MATAGFSQQTFQEQILFKGGDYGSQCFRIPAITTTKTGVLIAVCDARYNGCGDLGGTTPIDIIMRRSRDSGTTWDSAKVIAHIANKGCSDPALVTDRQTGTVWCLFASNNGLFASTPTNRIEVTYVKSNDAGVTWTAPAVISSQIYAPAWYAAWVASGSACQTRAGTLCAAIGVRENSGTVISNFMIYSNDHGATWHSGQNRASPTGDEAKVLDRNDGTIMMNIRNAQYRKIVLSADSGRTWGTPYLDSGLIDPTCNADLIRYTSVLDGYNKNRILFSNPASTSRQNMTVRLSYDEGRTWPVSRVITSGASAYSALTVINDGSIGLFYEKGSAIQMVFARFSLEWLSSGRDTLIMPQTGIRQSSSQKKSAFEMRIKIQEGILTLAASGIHAGPISIELRDIQGRMLLVKTAFACPGINERIDVSGFPHGLYLLSAAAETGIAARKIIIR